MKHGRRTHEAPVLLLPEMRRTYRLVGSGYAVSQVQGEHMKAIAWYDPSNGVVSTDQDCPLFTPLGQVWPLCLKREWVGLTDEQANEYNYLGPDMYWVAQEIAAILKEKNT